MFEQPFNPNNTKWNVLAFENDSLENSNQAIWEFYGDQAHFMKDRDKWVGHWDSTPGQNDRIYFYSTVGNGTIVFQNDHRFIALSENNEILRYGKRL
ncbi:hypothetical protein [Methanosarcina sp. UBA5]|uniref:hypothetical protein n=1 Tax=Methanosarcina sp. UBA5 TaxID=1915593 RepID=UPI0025F5C13A|nr:hypothetical protein [Methanosarcina sp. UBA5]